VIAVIPLRFENPPGPQWTRLFSYLDDHRYPDRARSATAPDPITTVWQGAFVGARAARVYLQYGRWPVPTRNNAGELIAQPTPGAVILYHRRDGWNPGDNERQIFHEGDITATVLGDGGWKPVRAPDPGE
jgi:hypothetical protein